MSKPTTAFSEPAKPKTAMSDTTKVLTPYQTGTDSSPLTLGDSTVTLGDIQYNLLGWKHAEPNQISFKPKTTYADA